MFRFRPNVLLVMTAINVSCSNQSKRCRHNDPRVPQGRSCTIGIGFGSEHFLADTLPITSPTKVLWSCHSIQTERNRFCYTFKINKTFLTAVNRNTLKLTKRKICLKSIFCKKYDGRSGMSVVKSMRFPRRYLHIKAPTTKVKYNRKVRMVELSNLKHGANVKILHV